MFRHKKNLQRPALYQIEVSESVYKETSKQQNLSEKIAFEN